MPGWNESATTPDLSEWLRENLELLDFGPAEAETPIRRKVARRKARTPNEVFGHLYDQGMSAEQALRMTLAHLDNGGDAEVFEVTELDPQEWVDTRKPRSRFERLTTGKTDRLHPWTMPGLNKHRPSLEDDTDDRSMQLARQWRAMRR
jgi:hypothetical protein